MSNEDRAKDALLKLGEALASASIMTLEFKDDQGYTVKKIRYKETEDFIWYLLVDVFEVDEDLLYDVNFDKLNEKEMKRFVKRAIEQALKNSRQENKYQVIHTWQFSTSTTDTVSSDK